MMTADIKIPTRDLPGLIEIMSRLRNPDSGCPWDLEQDFSSIAPYTIEEAYEVADAIERKDMPALQDELGDLLFQVVFYAQLASEQNLFQFDDIAAGVANKMIRRHPHVFGNSKIDTAAAQTEAWEDQKAREREAKGHESLLDDIPAGLPGLSRAIKLQNRAAKVGFDWPDVKPVLDKMDEERHELVEAMNNNDAAHIEEEYGDLLFVMANLARHLKIDPEKALRAANQKFTTRFQHIENELHKQKRTTKNASLEEMEELWNAAKKR